MSELQVQEKKAYLTVAEMLDKSKQSIADALPRHIGVDRLARVALSELRTNPTLLRCTPDSLMNCIVKAGQLGFELGSALGQVYLVPYKNEATLIVGYRGLIALARRSGEIQSLTSRVVHEHDEFEVEFGLDEKLRHIPSIGADAGAMTHVYAIAKLTGGGVQYEVMTRREVEDIRRRSRAGGSGPWVTDFEEMARKSVVRRLFKYLPVSIEMADAMNLDEDRIEVDITPRASEESPQPAASRTDAVKAKLAGKKAKTEPAIDLDDVLSAIASAESMEALKEAGALAAKLGDADAKATARSAYSARKEALEAPPALDLTEPSDLERILAGIARHDPEDLDVWLDEARICGLDTDGMAKVEAAIAGRRG